jgi:hypothetical protein
MSEKLGVRRPVSIIGVENFGDLGLQHNNKSGSHETCDGERIY